MNDAIDRILKTRFLVYILISVIIIQPITVSLINDYCNSSSALINDIGDNGSEDSTILSVDADQNLLMDNCPSLNCEYCCQCFDQCAHALIVKNTSLFYGEVLPRFFVHRKGATLEFVDSLLRPPIA